MAGLPAWGLCGELTAPHLEKSACHEMLHRISDLSSFFGRTEAMHNGHTIWNLECEGQRRTLKRVIQLVRLVGSAGCQKKKAGHSNSKGFALLYGK
jgi:hypothetical protein